MKQITPIQQYKKLYKGNIADTLFDDMPCIIVSLLTATFSLAKTYPVLGYREEFNGKNYPCDENGYCTLNEANRVIRALFDVKKYTYFKRSDRKKLKNLDLSGINIICCNGHFISVEGKGIHHL